MDKGSRVDKS